MSHLGERLTALVDGELGHEERDRALAHLATCAECRAEADTLRRLKGRLRGLDGFTPPSDLLNRLHAMGETAAPNAVEKTRRPSRRLGSDQVAPRAEASDVPSLRPGEAVRPGSVGGSRRPGGSRPGDRRAPRATGRRPKRYLIAGAATLAMLGVGSASFAAGGDQGKLPPVSPSMQQFAVEHARTAGEVPAEPVGDVTPSETARP